MRLFRGSGLVVLALLLPALLAAGAYLIVRSSLAQTPAPVPSGLINWNRHGPNGTPSSVKTGLDVPGNCDEPEHANDPGCIATRAAPGEGTPSPSATDDHGGRGGGGGSDDNSGSNSGSNSRSGSDSSGGSSSSGHGGGGGDDSSHSGSDTASDD